MYIEATCPVCESELVHEIDIYNNIGEGVTATAETLNTWELREFVSMKVAEILCMLPLPLQAVRDYLRQQGLGNLAERIIEEIKLHGGAYEREGMLHPA